MTQDFSHLGDRLQLVNVLMPIHNGAKFLPEMLTSLLRQTYGNWHLVAVLDRCTDESEKILNELIPEGQLTVVSVDYGNIGKNLNHGVSFCSEELIARIDCDDVMHINRIKNQTKFLSEHPEIAAVGSNLSYIDDESKYIGESNFPRRPSEITQMLLRKNCIAHPSVMFRKSAVTVIGLYSENAVGAEDYDLWLRMLSKGLLLANIPEKLIFYRIHSSQVSRQRLQRSTVTTIAQSQRMAAKYVGKPFLGLAGNIYLRVVNSRYVSLLWSWRKFLRLGISK